MLPLLHQTVRYCFRTKLVWFVFGLGFLIQWMGLSILSMAQIQVSDHLEMGPALSGPQFLFGALILQMFVGTFLAAVYGIWSIPYMHRGERAVLTFVLPIQKWKYPLCYAIVFMLLLGLLHVIMLTVYGIKFGFSEIPAQALILSLVMESFAFLVMTSAFAVSSLVLGSVPTFFVGTGLLFILQISALLQQLSWTEGFRSGPLASWYFAIYDLLPPIGGLVYDMYKQFQVPSVAHMHLPRWVIWFAVLSALLVLKLLYPGKSKPAEN